MTRFALAIALSFVACAAGCGRTDQPGVNQSNRTTVNRPIDTAPTTPPTGTQPGANNGQPAGQPGNQTGAGASR